MLAWNKDHSKDLSQFSSEIKDCKSSLFHLCWPPAISTEQWSNAALLQLNFQYGKDIYLVSVLSGHNLKANYGVGMNTNNCRMDLAFLWDFEKALKDTSCIDLQILLLQPTLHEFSPSKSTSLQQGKWSHMSPSSSKSTDCSVPHKTYKGLCWVSASCWRGQTHIAQHIVTCPNL